MTVEAKNYLDTIDLNVEWGTWEKEAIDNLTSKENNSIDPIHLQNALQNTDISVQWEKMKFSIMVNTFDKYIQATDDRKLSLKDDASDIPERVKNMVNSPKDNDLAYFIQKISQFINYNVAKGYGNRSDLVDVVRIDSILGKQTHRALAWLKNWVENNSEAPVFITMRELNELKDNNKLPEGIEYKDGDYVAKDGYKRIDPYGNNYAVQAVSEETTEEVTEETEEIVEEATETDPKIDKIDDTTILTLGQLYNVTITKENDTSYVIENGSESIRIAYDPEDVDSPYSIWSFSFKDVGTAIYVAKEINNIMTKVKNNQLSLRHFELSPTNQYLQADYKTRVLDFWSWNPFKMWKYSWIYDVNILDLDRFINRNNNPIGIDKNAFVDFMNDYYTSKKGSPAFKNMEKWDDNKVTIRSNGEEISYRLPTNPHENSIVKLKAWALTLEISYGEKWENINRVCAIINYIVSLVKNSWERLKYFEADGKALQVDYDWRYFDIDYIEDVKSTVGVEPKLFANWLNQYRKMNGTKA
jgi:hypothetical protein